MRNTFETPWVDTVVPGPSTPSADAETMTALLAGLNASSECMRAYSDRTEQMVRGWMYNAQEAVHAEQEKREFTPIYWYRQPGQPPIMTLWEMNDE